MREIIIFAFLEWLLVVITNVNGCHYCSYFNAKEALLVGVGTDALRQLLDNIIPHDIPTGE